MANNVLLNGKFIENPQEINSVLLVIKQWLGQTYFSQKTA